jgi:kynureninase
MITPDQLYQSPNAIAPYYQRFRVADRLLLTGHSHQAWPDCAFAGQALAWMDAAEKVDRKWESAFERADFVRKGFARLLDDSPQNIALGQSTHEMVVRFLSALPLVTRPRLVTTDGEFHSLRRQLDRLSEEGIAVERVPSSPASSVAERLMAATDDHTAAVLVSSVFFHTGQIVSNLCGVYDKCQRIGAELLVDAYHSLNVVPFSLRREKLAGAFVVGGGYKYCQLGEGNCFLRFPEGTGLRPVVTGWYSEFSEISEVMDNRRVAYGKGPDRFAGSTYDPTSHYRAAEVFAFFRDNELDVELLREVSRHQIRLLADGFDALDLAPVLIARNHAVPLDSIAGFLVLHSPHAEKICKLLYERGVHTDFRGNALRLGPAPYLSDSQLSEAMDILREVCAAIN